MPKKFFLFFQIICAVFSCRVEITCVAKKTTVYLVLLWPQMLPRVAKETTAYLDQPLREQDFNGLLEEGEESRVVDTDPFPQ